MENQREEDEDFIFDNARELLAQGKAIEEVTKATGLSYAEVSLMDSLQKNSANHL